MYLLQGYEVADKILADTEHHADQSMTADGCYEFAVPWLAISALLQSCCPRFAEVIKNSKNSAILWSSPFLCSFPHVSVLYISTVLLIQCTEKTRMYLKSVAA